MYNAIDLATNKLERQIRKHKTKVNRKFREKGSSKHVFAEGNGIGTAVQEDIEDEQPQVVRQKRFNLKADG